MNGVGIIMSIILGGLAGWIAEKIMGANICLLYTSPSPRDS